MFATTLGLALIAVLCCSSLPRATVAAVLPQQSRHHDALHPTLERLAALPLDDPAAFKTLLEKQLELPSLDAIPTLTGQFEWLRNAARKMLADLPASLRDRSSKGRQANDNDDGVSPYWRFVPLLEGSVLPGNNLTFSTDCFGSVTLSVNATSTTINGHQYLGYHLDAREQRQRECQSRWMVSTSGVSHRLSALFDQRIERFVNMSAMSESETFLLNRLGLRVFTFNGTFIEHVLSMVETALLFLPAENDPLSLLNNMDFINEFAQFDPPYTLRSNVLTPINPVTDIEEGDLIFKSTMDGLGTTIQLGSGGTPNHVAVPIRDEHGTLQVCESTDPVILCTEYNAWMAARQLQDAGVVLAPVDPALRAKFNRTKAWEFIRPTLGLEYGYNNFFFGWVDAAENSYPCFPPDFKRCMKFEHVEYLLQWLERLSRPLADKFYLQALNHRAGTVGLPYAELMQSAWVNKGLRPGEVMAVPENDAWRYNTTLNGQPVVGRSMVCSTFACAVLRAAGSFDGNLSSPAALQCAEQTPWNMQAYRLFDPKRMGANRPVACQLLDPTNANCQLSGSMHFHLGKTPNVQTLKDGAGNDCESVAPWYSRGPNCRPE